MKRLAKLVFPRMRFSCVEASLRAARVKIASDLPVDGPPNVLAIVAPPPPCHGRACLPGEALA